MTIPRVLLLLLTCCLLPLMTAARPLDSGRAAGAARLDASVAALPVGLPDKKGGERELSYAFGKRSTAEDMAAVAEQSLIDRAYFARRAAEGEADYSLALALDRARSSHQDLTGWQSTASSYEVSAVVSFRWIDAQGLVVSEGQLDGSARVSTEGSPGKPDALRAWSELIDDAVSRAFSQAFEAAAFGNAPPAACGWIGGEPGR